ncbi:MAG: hypothetical protein K6C12_02745 [Oscillospiraceae bacterium]|nr:hypothetical protein [Oscillospiraceae bacterium]
MKKLLLVLAIMASAAAFSAHGEASAEAAEPAVSEPAEAAVLLDRVGAVVKTYHLDEKVTVTEEKDGYCLLSDGCLVERWLIRLESEKDPEERTAYAKSGGETPLYDNPYLEGKPIRMLKADQTLSVKDEFGQVLRVLVEENGDSKETAGYLAAGETRSTAGYGFDYGGAYSGGGGSIDGGEISLTGYTVNERKDGFILLASTTESGKNSAKERPARILAENTEGYACVFRRGDEVRVTEKGKEVSVLLLDDGTTAEVPTKLLFFKGDKTYKPWTGHARAGTVFWRNWRTHLEKGESLEINTELQIIGSFGDFLIAEKKNHTVGLVRTEQVSEKPVSVADYSGGDYSGSGGGDTWTPPAL